MRSCQRCTRRRDYFSRTIVKEPGRAAGRTTHPEFRVALQPSPCRVVPSSGPVTGTDSVNPSAARKTPPLASRRPHRAERVKLRKNTVPAPGMPTLPVVSLVPLPPAGIVSTGPSTKRRRNSTTRTCCAWRADFTGSSSPSSGPAGARRDGAAIVVRNRRRRSWNAVGDVRVGRVYRLEFHRGPVGTRIRVARDADLPALGVDAAAPRKRVGHVFACGHGGERPDRTILRGRLGLERDRIFPARVLARRRPGIGVPVSNFEKRLHAEIGQEGACGGIKARPIQPLNHLVLNFLEGGQTQ